MNNKTLMADAVTLFTTITREDVDKLTLFAGDERDIATGQPSRLRVNGLPAHLQAEIAGGQSGYAFSLMRNGDIHPYQQQQRSRTPEAALEALKRLLTWSV